MKINEVVIKEQPTFRRSKNNPDNKIQNVAQTNSKPHIPIGTRYYDKGQNYEWNGNLWVNITKGVKSATKQQQAKLNALFPEPTSSGPDDDGPKQPQNVPKNVKTVPSKTNIPKKWPDQPPAWDGPANRGYPRTVKLGGELVPPPDLVGPKSAKFIFPNGGFISIANTPAAGLTYKDYPPINRVYVPYYIGKIENILRGNQFFYIEDDQKNLRLLDRTNKEGLKVTKGIVNTLLKTNKKPGMMQRARDAMDDFLDPDDPTRSGYRVLQDPKANRNELGVIGARIGDKIDSYLGLNKRK